MSQASIYEDFGRVGDMGPVGAALARFAESLSPDSEFKLENKRWVLRPKNLVTFQIQVKKPVIVMTFSGHPVQFKDRAENAGLRIEWQKLDQAMSSYSSYKITSAGQLLAASQFIKWGKEYAERRRVRSTNI